MSADNRRIMWQENKIVSIKLRNGHYALMQMLAGKGEIAVFDCFSDRDEWNGVELTKRNVLFIGMMLRDVLARSTVAVHREVNFVEGLSYPTTRIDMGSGFRRVKLWAETEHEIEFLMMGNFDTALRKLHQVNGHITEEYSTIALAEYDEYQGYELTNLYGYPSFNERIYLCELLGKNVDPLKELAFNRPIPLEYRTYIQIISGKTLLTTLGY